MPKYEILHTRIGEMLEIMACNAIAHGADPEESNREHHMAHEDAMKLR